MIARYCVEDNVNEKVEYDLNKKVEFDLLKSIIKNLFGNYVLYDSIEIENTL